ncbi:MAG TPA: hypothetical protein VLS48_00360, partial [Anaerolineales bacterium]|nr:hypothetical protein [Anaerolineales bacterium]
MGVLRYKIINDLWKNRGRTLQVMLIIGIGAAAIGMILGTRDLVIPGMQDQWQAIHPASINFFVGPPVTEDELEVLKRTDDVKQVEGASATTIEWRLDPAGEWKQGGLNARADYESQQLNTLELLEGDWPDENALALGQDGDTFYGIPKNSTVYLRINGREEAFPLSGMVYNMFVQPAAFGGTPQFYASQETYERLTESTGFGQLLISTTYTEYSEEQTAEVADRVQDRLEDMNKGAARFLIDPNKHFFQDQLDGLFFLLGILGMLA